VAREFDLDAFMDRAPSVRGGERGEQHFILSGKQLAAVPGQMRFERLLVQNEMMRAR
jgi:hypothetical protein